jgi:hypothetical protein
MKKENPNAISINVNLNLPPDVLGEGTSLFFRDCSKQKNTAVKAADAWFAALSKQYFDTYTENLRLLWVSKMTKWEQCRQQWDWGGLFNDAWNACREAAQVNYDLNKTLLEEAYDLDTIKLQTGLRDRYDTINKQYLSCCASLSGMASCQYGDLSSEQV